MSTVIVVGGPAGTGKTTIAELLSSHLSCSFIEGDSLHPKQNVDKMSRGQALTDDDRWGWLKTISETATDAAGADTSHVAVVSCSMLKKVYRDYLQEVGTKRSSSVQFRFVFLYTTFEELLHRVGQRQNHFMKSDMVKSQYDIMEIPAGAETVANGGAAIPVDTTNKDPSTIKTEVLEQLRL